MSFSFQSVLNFSFHDGLVPSSTPLVMVCMILSSHVVRTIELVRVVSKVSTRSGLSCRTSVSLRIIDWIFDNDAAVSFSWEQSESTVTGARFQALRISHNVLAVPTQLPVMRSCVSSRC